METSLALNRLSKAAKVRASADESELRGELDVAAQLRRIAKRNEDGVFAARPDLKPRRWTVMGRIRDDGLTWWAELDGPKPHYDGEVTELIEAAKDEKENP